MFRDFDTGETITNCPGCGEVVLMLTTYEPAVWVTHMDRATRVRHILKDLRRAPLFFGQEGAIQAAEVQLADLVQRYERGGAIPDDRLPF